MPTRAYGENNSYVDLEDMENTVGAWARYDDDNPKRYPDLQVEFFERAAAPLVDRRVASIFLSSVFLGLAAGFFFKGAYDLNLPDVAQGNGTRFERALGPPGVCKSEASYITPLCYDWVQKK